MGQITFRDEGNKTFYSCGCKTEVIGENYIISPCSLECEVYKFNIEETNKQGNKLSILDLTKDMK